jgi:hypothetical protein
VLERAAELLEILVVASVPSSMLESVWMATEEENREMMMFEAVSIDLAPGDKYLGSRDGRSSTSDHIIISQGLGKDICSNLTL